MAWSVPSNRSYRSRSDGTGQVAGSRAAGEERLDAQEPDDPGRQSERRWNRGRILLVERRGHLDEFAVQLSSCRDDVVDRPEAVHQLAGCDAQDRSRRDEPIAVERRGGQIGGTKPDVRAEFGEPRVLQDDAPVTPIGELPLIGGGEGGVPGPVPRFGGRSAAGVLGCLPGDQPIRQHVRAAVVGDVAGDDHP